MAAAFVALTGVLSACTGGDQGSGPVTIVQPSGAPSQATGVPTTGVPSASEAGSPDAGSPGAGSPDAGSPGAGSPDAGSPGAGSPGEGSPGSPAPSGPVPTAAPITSPAPASGGFTPVDASKFLIDGSYYFQSPTGNVKCGVLVMAPYGVGCQLGQAKFLPAALPNCTDAPNRKVAAHLYQGTSELLCTSQGIFIGFPPGGPSGGTVLNYGESLTVHGYTCASSTQGVRCVAGEHGFAISADDQHVF
ncbi:hypothetical protein [Nocardia lasii]|uniref:Uncharacterized protein n=1 Tax=Nocardia lasii TaxID=1616107 RepID=A0ABW1JS14_9NOCA